MPPDTSSTLRELPRARTTALTRPRKEALAVTIPVLGTGTGTGTGTEEPDTTAEHDAISEGVVRHG